MLLVIGGLVYNEQYFASDYFLRLADYVIIHFKGKLPMNEVYGIAVAIGAKLMLFGKALGLGPQRHGGVFDQSGLRDGDLLIGKHGYGDGTAFLHGDGEEPQIIEKADVVEDTDIIEDAEIVE